VSFRSADVDAYLRQEGEPVRNIPAQFGGKLETDLKRRQEGERVQSRMNGKLRQVLRKAYSECGNVCERPPSTVQDFRVYRPEEGGPEDDLQWRPLRKGIADFTAAPKSHRSR